MMAAMPPRAMILGCAGEVLSREESDFMAEADPLGFILFSRNCASPGQVGQLSAQLGAAVGRDDAPILIDQEGGRVQRLGPPHWRAAPPAGLIARLARQDLEAGLQAARLNARLIAGELVGLGISVNCAPVLDIPTPGADPIIGDRAAGWDGPSAAALGRAACEGFLAGGILPVIKHIPGHGRGAVDSHKTLPRTAASFEELKESDFAPFRDLADMPWAMTAHMAYEAIDEERPATQSALVISEIIRGHMGFEGVLISDDLSMGALSGSLGERARMSLEAGCDLVLHCNGEMEEMREVAEQTPILSETALARLSAGAARPGPVQPLEDGALKHLDGLLAEARAA
jgi:beta-N-acetylhexosaminidase